MLTLKIMSGENRANFEPDPDYRIIGGIKEIKFCRVRATKHECKELGLKCLHGVLGPEGQIQLWSVSVAECSFPDTDVLSNYLLDGDCYVMNDQGQTVDTYRPMNKIIDVT